MAVIGAVIGEGVRKESNPLELNVIINIAASAFLAYLAALGLQSIGTVADGVLISLSGLFGYLGDQYSKGWLLKALKRYEMREDRPREITGSKEEKKKSGEVKEIKKNSSKEKQR
jgi:hypothetical protein